MTLALLFTLNTNPCLTMGFFMDDVLEPSDSKEWIDEMAREIDPDRRIGLEIQGIELLGTVLLDQFAGYKFRANRVESNSN